MQSSPPARRRHRSGPTWIHLFRAANHETNLISYSLIFNYFSHFHLKNAWHFVRDLFARGLRLLGIWTGQ